MEGLNGSFASPSLTQAPSSFVAALEHTGGVMISDLLGAVRASSTHPDVADPRLLQGHGSAGLRALLSALAPGVLEVAPHLLVHSEGHMISIWRLWELVWTSGRGSDTVSELGAPSQRGAEGDSHSDSSIGSSTGRCLPQLTVGSKSAA